MTALIILVVIAIVAAFMLGGLYANAVAERGNRKRFDPVTGEFVGPDRRKV